MIIIGSSSQSRFDDHTLPAVPDNISLITAAEHSAVILIEPDKERIIGCGLLEPPVIEQISARNIFVLLLRIVIREQECANDILEGISGGEITAEAREQVDRLLKTRFRPEFLNRIDEIVCYKPLTRNEIGSIVGLMIAGLNRRLEDKQLKVTLTDAALNAVIDRGFDPVFGARPLKRYLQSKVETLIARKVIAADVAPGTELTVDLDANGEIVIV